MTAPLLATRDALAEVLHELVCLAEDPPTGCGLADALLASGVVRDPATLADDDVLVGYVHNFVPLGFREGRDPYSNTYEAAQGILRALAAALTEDPS